MKEYYSLNINMEQNIGKFINDVKGLTELVVKKEIKDILQSIATDYNLNKQDLFKKYLSDQSENTSESNDITINHHKCIAITKNFKQCSRNKFCNNDYCKNHLRQSKLDGGLPQGTVHSIKHTQKSESIVNYESNIDNSEVVLEKSVIDGKIYYIDRLNNQHYTEGNTGAIEKVNL